ncbi:MAG: 30S ribosomal protein S16 [Candidatus Edwardsbacteria bacterium]
MPVKIRLRRIGKKKKPFYRVVVTDSRAPRDTKFIEIVGYYNPLTKPTIINLEMEKIEDWLKKGAQPTETVLRLLKQVEKQPEANAASLPKETAAENENSLKRKEERE